MTRPAPGALGLAALALLSLGIAVACGKYGPPRRISAPPAPAAEEAAEAAGPGAFDVLEETGPDEPPEGDPEARSEPTP